MMGYKCGYRAKDNSWYLEESDEFNAFVFDTKLEAVENAVLSFEGSHVLDYYLKKPMPQIVKKYLNDYFDIHPDKLL